MKYRNSTPARIEDFFEGTGVSVEEYDPGHCLSLLTKDMDDRDVYLYILLTADGTLKVWREFAE